MSKVLHNHRMHFILLPWTPNAVAMNEPSPIFLSWGRNTVAGGEHIRIIGRYIIHVSQESKRVICGEPLKLDCSRQTSGQAGALHVT